MAGGEDAPSDYGFLWAWESLTPADVAEIMRGFRAPRWICGGLALDLFVGRETRRHDDVDVGGTATRPSSTRSPPTSLRPNHPSLPKKPPTAGVREQRSHAPERLVESPRLLRRLWAASASHPASAEG
jgi:hypothetical protein